MGTSQSSLEDTNHNVEKVQQIRFYLQDKLHIAQGDDISPNTTLNYYLRSILKMTGTKGMCFEGGCGSCVVVVQKKDPTTNKEVYISVNSCLVPLLSCNGWRIITIEGIGNRIDGYHPLQEVLAQFNGTQCGFCSPGMVMSMYALYESGKFTMKQVEDVFSGNLCRCTGYRPILSAFKSLAHDASREVLGECPDMEEFVMCYKEKCEKKCSAPCSRAPQMSFYMEFGQSAWIKVHSLKDLLAALADRRKTYRLVAGNTAQGVYPSYKDHVDLYIDVSDVTELVEYKFQATACSLGANTTLTDTINIFNDLASKFLIFGYLKKLADHIELVANLPVRNRGTLAGNLMIKHDHHDFPSDIFLILETAGAVLTVVDLNKHETRMSPREFIDLDMTKQRKVLKTITLNSLPSNAQYVSYKIMPRAQNVHAMVNAGFLFKFGATTKLESTTMVYGNINPTFIHATATEDFLKGKQLFDNSILHQAYINLDKELNPNLAPPDPSPQLRKQLAIALFYKAVLSIAPDGKLSSQIKSGGTVLQRPVSKGTQDYETNKSLYPVTEAIPKLEALAQTTGEAQYIPDLPDLPFQLHGALVLANAVPGSIVTKVDPTKALRLKGVVAYYDKSDIPGVNTFTVVMPAVNSEEELFVNGTVKYYDQPIGIVVAESKDTAEAAAKLVEVSYIPSPSKPLVTIRQVLKNKRTDRITEYNTIIARRKGTDIKHVLNGSFDVYHQYHFHMETQCCQVVPNEDGLHVYSATQWMDLIQAAVSKVLNIPQSNVHVIVRRCGGAFGGKISRNSLVGCATALAAWKLQRPVRTWISLQTNMSVMGKRFPFSLDYEVGVDNNGAIQFFNGTWYTDAGYVFDEDITVHIEKVFTQTYTSDTFTLHMNRVLTDTHAGTYARAPGNAEGVSALESVMDHIAYVTNLDPVKVRQANLSSDQALNKYITDINSWAQVEQRKNDIATFNKQNRWKKKGLSVPLMNFAMIPLGPYLVTVSIFHVDGSVQIRHGGTEVGQGINTKAAQVCAYELKIPLEKVKVLPSTSFAAPNSGATGGSITTESICYGIIQACGELNARIDPYRKVSWEETMKACYANQVKLIESGICSPKEPGLQEYPLYGICAIEVEVDILTGQHQLTRVDLIFDVGVSLSPLVDIGQVEGAFIMGLGYHTMEKIVFSKEGQILTNNTWTYHVPGAKDIPIEFNVKFPKNNPNPVGILYSKGTGEPSLCLAFGIPLAIRNALASARTDASSSNSKWYPIDGITDVENVFLNSCNDYSQYVLQ